MVAPPECRHGLTEEELSKRWESTVGFDGDISWCVCCSGPARAKDHGWSGETPFETNVVCRTCAPVYLPAFGIR